MSAYVLRERAEVDLADIWSFSAERWSSGQADRYYQDLVAAFVRLAAEPALGRACDDIREGYRRYNVGSHVVFYRLTAGQVDIVRILHARRDYRRHLPQA